MSEQIVDGTGRGYLVKVGSDNRLQSRSIVEQEVIHNGESGRAYNFNTGLISVTGDSTLLYLKNNSDNQLVVTGLALGVFDGISYTDAPYLTIVRNPTGGDLISDKSALAANQNRNSGSTLSASVDAYKGKTGGTLTGGNDLGYFLLSKTGRSFFGLDLIITRGTSYAVKLTLNGTGTANIYAAFIAYFKDTEDV